MEVRKRFLVSEMEKARIAKRTEEVLEARLGRVRAQKPKEHARTQYESIDALLDGEQFLTSRAIRGRIVA